MTKAEKIALVFCIIVVAGIFGYSLGTYQHNQSFSQGEALGRAKVFNSYHIGNVTLGQLWHDGVIELRENKDGTTTE